MIESTTTKGVGKMAGISAAWRETVWATRIVIAAYIAIGVGLTLQSSRFANTPAYANLLLFARSEVWGVMYLLVAALLVAWRLTYHIPRMSWFGVVAHTAAVILTSWWLVAFIIRYVTDDGTTIVNIVSWGVFFSLVIRSSRRIEGEAVVL